MQRGKIARRLMRLRARLQPRAATGAGRTEHVAGQEDLARRLAELSWRSVSRGRRVHLVLEPGTYRLRVELLDGLDITGPATITWDGPGDTVLTHGADSRLTDLTIVHTGSEDGYAVHADAPCHRSTLTLDRVTVSAETAPAIGVGLTGGQSLTATGSSFLSNGRAAVYLHGSPQQRQPACFEFTDCAATAPQGVGVSWHDVGDSSQPDRVSWTGPIDARQAVNGAGLPADFSVEA